MPYSRFLKHDVSEDTGPSKFLCYATLTTGRRMLRNLLKRRSVRSVERTSAFVEQKYDDYRSKIPLGTFDDYVLGTLPRDFTVVDGQVKFTHSQLAVGGYLRILRELIGRYATDGAVVELGCGGGRNLFYLGKHGIKNPLVGFELSGASVDLARRASRHFGIDARFEQVDVTQPLPPIGSVDVVFSIHAFEMMPRIFVGGVENIRRLQPSVAIFLEPIEEIWSHSVRGMLSRIRVRQLDRLRGFYPEAAMLGRVVEARELEYATNPLNPTSLMVVEIGR
jgi:SAM-dependent methyltransferase